MRDIDKTIKGLECCMSEKQCNSPCPYRGECDDGGYYYSKAIENARSMLEAQKPKTIIIDDPPKDGFTWFGIWFGRCPQCGRSLVKDKHKKYCGYCGQAVKWND